jgi:hypothetical protein
MHVFSAGDTDKDDDDEWLPGSEDEGSEDEDSDEFLLENNSDSE